MIVIGLVGEKRGGKGTFTNLLREALPSKNIVRIGFGDIIGDLLDILGKPKTRDNMQKLPVAINSVFGNSTITEAMRIRIQKLAADIVILDGIRLTSDVELLREFRKNFLIYVTANVEIRYARARMAAEKIGENSISLEEFRRQDNAEIEMLIPQIGLKSDYILANNKALEDYRWHIETINKLFITPLE